MTSASPLHEPKSPPPRVVPIPLGFVNAYLVRGARDVLVDAGTPGHESRIRDALTREGVRELSLLVATHAHHDHVGAAAALAERYGAPIAMGRADAELAQAGRLAPVKAITPLLRPMAKRMSRTPLERPCRAEVIVAGSDVSLASFGIPRSLTPTPGHTEGSITLALEDGRCVVGDLLNGGMPFGASRPGNPIIGEAAQMRAEVRRLHEAGATRMHVGHGAPAGFDRQQIARWLG